MEIDILHIDKNIRDKWKINEEKMVEIEKRQEILVEILRDIASEHPEVRDKIMRRLSDIAKENEVITIVQDV